MRAIRHDVFRTCRRPPADGCAVRDRAHLGPEVEFRCGVLNCGLREEDALGDAVVETGLAIVGNAGDEVADEADFVRQDERVEADTGELVGRSRVVAGEEVERLIRADRVGAFAASDEVTL